MKILICYETAMKSVPNTCMDCEYEECHYYHRRQSILGRIECCPLICFTRPNDLLESLEARRNWYIKASNMLTGKIPWEDGFDFPDSIAGKDHLQLVSSWDRIAAELDGNAIRMLRDYSKRCIVFAEEGRNE